MYSCLTLIRGAINKRRCLATKSHILYDFLDDEKEKRDKGMSITVKKAHWAGDKRGLWNTDAPSCSCTEYTKIHTKTSGCSHFLIEKSLYFSIKTLDRV